MTGHASQVWAAVTGFESSEIKWPLNAPTTSRRGGRCRWVGFGALSRAAAGPEVNVADYSDQPCSTSFSSSSSRRCRRSSSYSRMPQTGHISRCGSDLGVRLLGRLPARTRHARHDARRRLLKRLGKRATHWHLWGSGQRERSSRVDRCQLWQSRSMTAHRLATS